jgi:hypothetical protein
MESSNLNADVFNSVQQEKMALEGKIIHLESVNKEKEEVHQIIRFYT